MVTLIGFTIFHYLLRVRELNILSACFLKSTYGVPVLAILYKDHTGQLILSSHEVSLAELEVHNAVSALLPEVIIRYGTANILIPIPAYTDISWNINGGILLLGGRKITFYACETVDRKQKRRKSGSSGVSNQSDSIKRRQAIIQIDWPYSAIAA